MTNSEAVKIAMAKGVESGTHNKVASIYACEDIIEHDVETLTKTPKSELLSQFVDYSEQASELVVSRQSAKHADIMSEAFNSSHSVMRSMIAYLEILEEIEKAGN